MRKIVDKEQYVALKSGHLVANNAVLHWSNPHVFLDHCKLKILKKMLVTPHSYKGNAPKIGPFDIIPSMILSRKDKMSVEVVEILLTIFFHNSHMLYDNLYGFFFFGCPSHLKFESFH